MNKFSKEEERQILLFASLLHDIGKLVQRANPDPSQKTHSQFGADWFANRFPHDLLPPRLRPPIESLIYNHHNSTAPQLENLHKILQEADYLSAGERPEKEDPYKDEKGRWRNWEIPLRSILSQVQLEGKPPPSPSYWKLQSLTSSFTHPLPRDSAIPSQTDYEEILQTLNQNISPIKSLPALLALLEECLTFVPSETREVLKDGLPVTEKDPDISLYDHLKLTSAIALSLYDGEEREFLLLRGDISGVQNFIYTISSKGALKSLRARSLYIELLSNHIPALILEEFKLPPTNLVFCGGAHFTLLLPNTQNAEEILQKMREKVNAWLWENFRGKLYLALQWLPLSKEEIVGKGLVQKQGELSSLIEEEKLRKFAQLPHLFQPLEVKEGRCKDNKEHIVYECDVCRASADEFRSPLEGEEHLHLCPLCYSLFKVGRDIPKLKNPCFVALPDGDIPLPGSSYKLMEIKELEPCLPKTERIFALNAEPSSLPFHPHIYFLPLARYIKRNEKGEGYDLEEFSEAAKGAKRIGVLRLDVDHLGRIFSRGLGENYSFSRIATLSRFLTIFFKTYVDDRLKDKNVAVIYSGGDDAFIVGAWDDVLESAFEIQEKFSQFTQNPSFTISAGYLATHPKSPLYQLAERSGKLEESAKESGRDSFAIFLSKREENFREQFRKEPTWNECRKIKGWKEEILKNFAREKGTFYELELPRSLLYRLMEISRQWQRGESIYPYIYLIYLKGKMRENLRKIKKEDKWPQLANILGKDNIPHFIHLFHWIDPLVREKGGES